MHIQLLLLAYAGMALHYLMRFKDLLGSNDRAPLNIPQEIVGAIISILTTTILVYVKDDIASIYVVTPVGAVLLGYAGQSVFNKLVSTRFPQQKSPGTERLMDTETDVVGDGTRPAHGKGKG